MGKVGVLLPIASLPGKYGIGDLGEVAYQWVDRLSEAGIKVWKVLSINSNELEGRKKPAEDSYQGEELYISLEALKEDGLLSEEDISNKISGKHRIDYLKVREEKEQLLSRAYLTFCVSNGQDREDYKQFVSEEWVKSFSENSYIVFKRFIFQKQWKELCEYAKSKGVTIITECSKEPIYNLQEWILKDKFEEEIRNKDHYVICTGTYDTPTVRGWYSELESEEKRTVKKRLLNLGIKKVPASQAFCELALSSSAELALILVQDFLDVSDSGKGHKLGTIKNQDWKLKDFSEWDKRTDKIKQMLKEHSRI